jgi:hypothetical protein
MTFSAPETSDCQATAEGVPGASNYAPQQGNAVQRKDPIVGQEHKRRSRHAEHAGGQGTSATSQKSEASGFVQRS